MPESAPPTNRHNHFAKRKIGLLGGSFNPAHEGHIHISLQAIKRLGLDEVWWLVSPQNPLKSADEMADTATRVAHARNLTNAHRQIVIREDEITQQLKYSYESVTYFQTRYPQSQFVWLMGADNLAQFHRWRDWQVLANTIPIAVLDRAPYSFHALTGKMAKRFHFSRLNEAQARYITQKKPPTWVYLNIPRHALSATFLRKTLGKDAFLRHNNQ